MSIQNSLNSLTGTVAGAVVAGKHLSNQKQTNEKLSKLGRDVADRTDFNQLNAEQAFLKSNKGLVDELTKKRAGLLRTKRMLEATGKWGDAQTNRLANLEAEIKRYSSAGAEVEQHLEGQIDKLGRGTTTFFEEDK